MKKTYFICEEHCIVEGLKPHMLNEELPLFRSDAFIHPLHREIDGWKRLPKASSILMTLPRVSVIRLKLVYLPR